MKIKKNARGWQIVPSMSDEQTALEFILEALEETYVKVAETTETDSASYLSLEAPTPQMVESV